jgi:LPS export ABC transporter protein LptC
MLASKRTLTRILVIGIALLFGILAAVFIKYREFSENPAKLVEALPDGADISIDDIQHTAVKDGRKEWSLEAASANYNDSAQSAVFEDVRVVFFMEDGREITVKGRRGQLDTGTNDIEMTGDVIVNDEDYELAAEKLVYDQARRKVDIPVPVRIQGHSFTLQADAMTIDLGTETAHLEGSVEGIISGNQIPQF